MFVPELLETGALCTCGTAALNSGRELGVWGATDMLVNDSKDGFVGTVV